MKVFLLRHAQAEYGGPDPERPLSQQGLEISRKLASFIEDNPYFTFRQIWCSPYLRARQTAEPFIRLLPDPDSIKFMDSLTPSSDPSIVHQKIIKSEEGLLLVGHNPHLSILTSRLLGCSGHGFPLPLKKAALVVLKPDPYYASGFTLSACLTPSALGFKQGGLLSR